MGFGGYEWHIALLINESGGEREREDEQAKAELAAEIRAVLEKEKYQRIVSYADIDPE